MKVKGVVVKWDIKKGFGFVNITHDFVDNSFVEPAILRGDAFVHYRDIKDENLGFKKLILGQVIIGELSICEKGKMSVTKVEVIGTIMNVEGELDGNKRI